MSELYLPHEWAHDSWWLAYLALAAELEASELKAGRIVAAHAALARALVSCGQQDLAAAIAHGLVAGEPPADGRAEGQRALLRRDLETLARAARRDLGAESRAATGADVPELKRLAPRSRSDEVNAMRDAVLAAPVEDLVTGYLTGLERHGGGLAAVNAALRWRRGGLEAVVAPAAASFADLIGLDEQLGRLRANTEALLGGTGAHNVLLYGPRGSGKSTAVRALLTSYQDEGLRLIELPLEELSDLPELLERLRGRPQGFVLFVDDLAFEEGDTSYRPLRTLLEGGLSGRPHNVALYATSNRRHLLKERFRDRPDPLDDDVHRWDSQHEKLALADRFGVTITFPDAGQRRYLELVRGLVVRHGLEHTAGVDVPSLEEAAIRFAEWGNGYSGRTAAQFVASLASARATA